MDDKKRVKETKPDVSRRKFITKAMTGAGATAVTVLSNGKASAADKESNNAAVKPITVPDEFAQAAQRLSNPDFNACCRKHCAQHAALFGDGDLVNWIWRSADAGTPIDSRFAIFDSWRQ